MEILFNDDICIFNKLTNLEKVKKKPLYRKYFQPILKNWIKEILEDEVRIDSIHIEHNKKTYGTTYPIFKNNCLSFKIVIDDRILLHTSEIQNSTETYKSKSIFQHEMFHCKEIYTLFKSNLLEQPNPLNDNYKINTTYNFLYSEAINLWSEFYACYNNYQINLWHEIPNIEIDLKQIDKWLKATHSFIKESKTGEAKLCKEMLNDIHKFWYHMISIIAVYMNNKEPLLLKEFSDIYPEYPYLEDYFKLVYGYLSKLIRTYPEWISEGEYMVFGKILLQILNFNNITFSTEELSDNFVFKLKKP